MDVHFPFDADAGSAPAAPGTLAWRRWRRSLGDAVATHAQLQAFTHFSYQQSASSPAELIATAQALNYAALAITDECSVAGVVQAFEQWQDLKEQEGARASAGGAAATDAPIPALIIGTTMQLSACEDDSVVLAGHPPPRLVLLAQSRRGYGNLVQWITLARRRAPKGEYRALAADIEGRAPDAPFIAGLPDCIAILVPAPAATLQTVHAQAQWMKTWFGMERAVLAASRTHSADEAHHLAVLQQAQRLTGLRIVACPAVRMHLRECAPLLDALTAVRVGRPIAQCGARLAANRQARLLRPRRLAWLYPAAWLQAALQIARECTFSLGELKYEYPREIVPDGQTPTTWLRHLTERGAVQRWPDGVPASVRKTIEHELALIAQLGYEPYFLTVADIVSWARERGILCQGRGSAANSAVCFCLHVTEVDPSRMTVLFERFISAERNEPPDIDIDFEHQRREEVIQYIYRKYGRKRAALTAVSIRYRPRSALRDMGRALGLDEERIAAVARGIHWFDGKRGIAPERLREHGFDPDARIVRQWMALSMQLVGFPRHLSQHPGGFVIARDDLASLVPVENAAMPGRSVIQWDKDDLDVLRLIKVDILALGMLSAIRRSLAFIAFKQGLPEPLPMSAILGDGREDPAVYDMLCRADSIGVFQVESRAQMSMLPRLAPRKFYDLVVEVAIVRPGPIQGGMVHPYLRRRSGDEAEDYPSEAVREALERTRGVPIFQEQVMQLAILAADFTPGEADKLRRAMAAWKRKGGLGPFHERLVGRMVEKGYTPDYAERIFKQIEGFGEYGFPESHAASFALLVYVSAWIKCHHPDAFLAALLNSQPMGFYAPAQLVRDAREHGVVVLPVDVSLSGWDSELVRPEAQTASWPVRLGLNRITGLAEAAAQRIVAARTERPFDDVEDLARRAQLDAHALGLLAQADSLQGIAGHRHAAAWSAAGIAARPTALLARTRTQESAPRLRAPQPAESTLADYRATGLTLGTHPVALVRAQLAALQIRTAAQLRAARNGQLARASGLVTHRQRPETANGVVFVTLEDETGSVNVIVWPDLAVRQRRELLGPGLMSVYGVWQCEGEVRHLVARRIVDHTALLEGLAMRSRDFR